MDLQVDFAAVAPASRSCKEPSAHARPFQPSSGDTITGPSQKQQLQPQESQPSRVRSRPPNIRKLTDSFAREVRVRLGRASCQVQPFRPEAHDEPRSAYKPPASGADRCSGKPQ